MAKVLTTRATGADAMLLNPGIARPLHTRHWEADLSRLVALDTSIDLVTLGPHEYDSTTSRTQFRPAVLLVAVASGRVQGTVGDRPFEVLPGQALQMDTREPLHSRVDEPVRLLRAVVDLRRLVGGPSRHRLAPPTVLSASPVLATCLGAVHELLHRSENATAADDDTVIAQLLTGLQATLIDESARQRLLSDDPHIVLSRREAINRYVTTHLDDPNLSPPAIANALGCSVRSLHAAFDGSMETVTSTIRRARMQRLLEEVDALEGAQVNVDDLVVACGYRDAAQLARSVRAATGMSLRN